MPSTFTHGYALLIGVTENAVARWALPDVAQDIAALAAVLAHPDRCGYPAGQVRVVTGPAATRPGILDGLEWLGARLAADTSGEATAVVYYSGHGWRDDAGQPPATYLIPYDVRENALRSRSLRAEDFAAAVGELRPRRLLVVLDCCHAAGLGVKALAPAGRFVAAAIPPVLFMAGAPPAAAGIKGLDALARGAGRAVLSSSQGDQPSYIRRDRAMSIFTYHLIEALTGHAQPAAGATEVLVSDVMSHVWRRVPLSARADCNAEQQPDFLVSGNFPVALLLGGQGLSKGMAPPDPLAAGAGQAQGRAPAIHTGGGAYIGGNVTIGNGKFVGRDDVTIIGDGNVVGDHSRATVSKRG
jgi:hypothetical protein